MRRPLCARLNSLSVQHSNSALFNDLVDFVRQSHQLFCLLFMSCLRPLISSFPNCRGTAENPPHQRNIWRNGARAWRRVRGQHKRVEHSDAYDAAGCRHLHRLIIRGSGHSYYCRNRANRPPRSHRHYYRGHRDELGASRRGRCLGLNSPDSNDIDEQAHLLFTSCHKPRSALSSTHQHQRFNRGSDPADHFKSRQPGGPLLFAR